MSYIDRTEVLGSFVVDGVKVQLVDELSWYNDEYESQGQVLLVGPQQARVPFEESVVSEAAVRKALADAEYGTITFTAAHADALELDRLRAQVQQYERSLKWAQDTERARKAEIETARAQAEEWHRRAVKSREQEERRLQAARAALAAREDHKPT